MQQSSNALGCLIMMFSYSRRAQNQKSANLDTNHSVQSVIKRIKIVQRGTEQSPSEMFLIFNSCST